MSTVDDDFRAFCLPEVDEKVDLEVDEMGITVHWRQAQFETWMQRTNYMDKLRVTSYEVSISPPDTDENIVTVEKYKTSGQWHGNKERINTTKHRNSSEGYKCTFTDLKGKKIIALNLRWLSYCNLRRDH